MANTGRCNSQLAPINRVVTPGGVRLVGYMDHTGCHQLNVF
jgi:hypothetical protein